MEQEFEQAVKEAIVQNKPLMALEMAGVKAETWPKGCGPKT